MQELDPMNQAALSTNGLQLPSAPTLTGGLQKPGGMALRADEVKDPGMQGRDTALSFRRDSLSRPGTPEECGSGGDASAFPHCEKA